ncbi:uncharacterized protein LOC142228969 [Haematobia irritans]|uniref:uncharacterized protein LOC142228969 n=1 Tax=Haematobia irritans TaxID=7368 RepID=UPI003F5032F8
MRGFMVLCCVIAVALAKPQYNYGSGVSGTFGSSSSSDYLSNGVLTAPTPSIGGTSSFGESSFSSGSSFHPSNVVGSSSFGVRPNAANNFQSNSFGSGSFNTGHSSHGYTAQSFEGFEAPLVHKHFITIAAPEDNENLETNKNLVIGRPQKNYRVIFIKAPSSSSANVKLSAQYAPQEEKTVIYVLSKNDNSLEVGDIATPAPTVPSKPEVHFIKYKTEEEAQHAQKQIQAEYDKIEGTSEHTDAGVAPQQSVVGILGDSGTSGAITTGSSFGTSSSSGGFNLGAAGSTTTGSHTISTSVSHNVDAGSSDQKDGIAYLPPSA